MPRKAVKRIHVNKQVIAANRKYGRNDPVITIKHRGTNTYCHEVEILGPSKVIYRPEKPLNCGARVWIETYSDIRIKEDPSRDLPDEAVESCLCPA